MTVGNGGQAADQVQDTLSQIRDLLASIDAKLPAPRPPGGRGVEVRGD